MTDAIQQFREALAARGIAPPDEIEADGRIHRCDVDGKRGKKGASYLLHLDGVPAGGFQNWSDGLGWQDWTAKSEHTIAPAERAAYRAKIEAASKEREAEEVKRHEEARKVCAIVWHQATSCDPGNPHQYLVREGVQAHGLRETRDGRLLIPVCVNGKLHSLQFIGVDGTKRFKTGGRKHSRYYAIGKPDGVPCIAEGYVTGTSIYVCFYLTPGMSVADWFRAFSTKRIEAPNFRPGDSLARLAEKDSSKKLPSAGRCGYNPSRSCMRKRDGCTHAPNGGRTS